MKFKEFIKEFVNKTKNLIQVFEEYSHLSGAEKKAQVDFRIKNWVEEVIDNSKINFLIKFILKTYILNNIPEITQTIFDLVKTRVQGITE